MTRTYEIFADYRQFYLWDRGAMPDVALLYDDEDVRRRVKTAPFLIVINPERAMDVPVSLDLRQTPPEGSTDEWDHIVEASIDLPSGELEIHESTGESIDILAVSPGTYRVRAYFAGLSTISDDGLDGDDRYHLAIWPAPTAETVVLNQYDD